MLRAGETRSGSLHNLRFAHPFMSHPESERFGPSTNPPFPPPSWVQPTAHLSIFESCMVSGSKSSPSMAETIIPPAYKTEGQDRPPSLRDGLYILTNHMSRTVLNLWEGTLESEAFGWSNEIQLIIFYCSRKPQRRNALCGVRAQHRWRY